MQIVSGDEPSQRWDDIYDHDVAGLDAGDVVTYLVIVENAGRGKDGAFDIRLREHLPPELEGMVVSGSLRAFTCNIVEIGLPLPQAAPRPRCW